MNSNLRIGALISGGGTNLQAVIDGCENDSISGRVVFVGSDNPEAKGLERARRHKIPSFVVDYGAIVHAYRQDPPRQPLPEDFDLKDTQVKCRLFPPAAEADRVRQFLETRAIAEAALIQAMRPYPYDLLILAGFMRTLTPYFIDRVNIDRDHPRIMNIHPAILPSFPGVDGYGDTYTYGCKVGGCTVHFIDYGEDTGPIIGQRAFAIQPGDTLETVKKNGLAEEWKLYPHCIELFAQGQLKVVAGPRRRIVAITT
jgi:phosphoribosylglycinamide formyltransferase-1